MKHNSATAWTDFRGTTYAYCHAAKCEPHQNLSIRGQACSLLQRVDKFPFEADWLAFQQKVKHDKDANGDVEEDCQV